jgi:hypothetical protein
MYGFPGQTVQETIDSLEVVRQFFSHNLLQSAFWHRYAMTCHSPSGRNPKQFGVERVSFKPNPFANNEVQYYDDTEIDHSKFGKGLNKAIYNFMHGIGIEEHVNFWFDFKVPIPRIAPEYISHVIGLGRQKRRNK